MRERKLRILVVGGGGREHAIIRKLKASPRVRQLYCAPGNAGIGKDATLVSIPATDIAKLLEFATVNCIDLTVVGPEAPLVAGIVDAFHRKGLAIFGPTTAAAKLEGSKAWAVEFMSRHGIPHPKSVVCADPEEARAGLMFSDGTVVFKADGLAQGKGVIIARNLLEASVAINRMMIYREFGDAGNRIVIQEFAEGREASCMVITDGTTIIPLLLSRDYKPANPGKDAPMTGGMGAYSPLPDVSAELEQRILDTIIRPAIRGMATDGHPFTGVLYAGLMLTCNGPKVLEFNCRFGDPEIQVVLARLDSDLGDLLWAVVNNTMDQVQPKWNNDPAVCVVAASKGYPGEYKKGHTISGLNSAIPDGAYLLHAGTAESKVPGDCITAGGRVLNAVAVGRNFGVARDCAYGALKEVHFDDMWYREDIAAGL